MNPAITFVVIITVSLVAFDLIRQYHQTQKFSQFLHLLCLNNEMQNSLVNMVMMICIINGAIKYFKFGMCPKNLVPTSLHTISVLKICRYEMLACFFICFKLRNYIILSSHFYLTENRSPLSYFNFLPLQ